MSDQLIFYPWRRTKLAAGATPGAGGRLQGKLPLTLTDIPTSQSASETVAFTLLSAADIAGLKSGAILRVAPRPYTHDAETTKLVHVDFVEPDLPWRYTPQAAQGDSLRPWLALLVGTAEELKVEGGIVTELSAEVLKAHNLDDSHLWAHVQDDQHGPPIARLLSPRGMELRSVQDPQPMGLLPQHEYVAAIVPTFDDKGGSMWTVHGDNVTPPAAPLPAFYSWRFWTAEAGDFETLAGALRVRDSGDLGKARLRYRRDVTGVDVTLEARGAITCLQSEPDQANDISTARADLDQLDDAVPDIAGGPERQILGLPQYGRPWVPEPDDPAAPLWAHTLNYDPRYRATGGLGLWLGIQGQASLMDAAAKQAGALDDAAVRIRQLALGLLTTQRLWCRRLPSDANQRLRIFGPAMGRMLAQDGGTVLERVTTGSSPLPPALFSSAAQRLLRDGTARARHAANGEGHISHSAALDRARQGPQRPARSPDGLPHADRILEEFGQPPLEKLFEIEEGIPELPEIAAKFAGQANDEQMRSELLHLLGEVGIDCGDFLDLALRRLEEAGWRFFEADRLLEVIRQQCLTHSADHFEGLDDFLVESTPPDPPDRFRSPSLDRLAAAVAGVIDPTAQQPPAWQRLSASIEGLDLTSLAPPELPLGLDYPTWQLVRQYAKEWLLPGSGTIQKDSIVSLQTNPAFIDAFMVGINTQFMAEMRWRNLPVARTFTPLRMFWGYLNYDTGQREADIQPLAQWALQPGTDIGDLAHQAIKPGDTTGKRDLVIAFRTDLFRRYPSTLVYLVKPPANASDTQVTDLLKQPPKLEHTPAERAEREYFGPIFYGEMDPDLVFFAFDVDPGSLEQYWLVLDEPPAELRFRNDRSPNKADGAQLARSTIDQPTRVAISGSYLEEQGLSQ